jgi:putative hydroxymethylpyrimidine transport system substrate-binding protein
MLKKCLMALLVTLINFVYAEPTTVKVALDWYINPDHAPLLVAQTYGYFAEQGLKVEFIEPSSSTDARNLVVTHKADIGIDYEPEVLLAINQGVPVKVFANLVPTPLTCMATLASGPIVKLADLQGKKIAYGGDPLEAALINAQLQRAGIDPASVTLVSVNMDFTQVLLSKQVDAVNGFMRNVEPVQLKAQGVATRLFYPENNGVPTYAELVLIVDPDHSDKAVLQKFITALNEGVATLKAHPIEAWNKVVAAYPQELASSQNIAATNKLIWLTTYPYFTDHMTYLASMDYQAYNLFLLKNDLIKQAIPLVRYWWNIN